MANDQYWFPIGCLWINLFPHFSYLPLFSCLLSSIAKRIYFPQGIATLQLFCNSCRSSSYFLVFLEAFDNFQKVSAVILLFALLLYLQVLNLKALFLFLVLRPLFHFYSSLLLLHFLVSLKLIYFDPVLSNLIVLIIFQVLKPFFLFFCNFLITFSFFFHLIFSILQYQLFHVFSW